MRRARTASKDRPKGLQSRSSGSTSKHVLNSSPSGSHLERTASRNNNNNNNNSRNSQSASDRSEPPELVRTARGGFSKRETERETLSPSRKKRKIADEKPYRAPRYRESSGSDSNSASSDSPSPEPRDVEPIASRRKQRHPTKRRRTASPDAQMRVVDTQEQFSMELPDVSPIPKVREDRFSSIAGSAAFTPARRGWDGRDTSGTREGTMGLAWSTIKSFLFTPAQARHKPCPTDGRGRWTDVAAVGSDPGVTTPTHQSSSTQDGPHESGNSASMPRTSMMMDFSHAMATPPKFAPHPASTTPAYPLGGNVIHRHVGDDDAGGDGASVNSSAAASPLSSHQRVRQMLRFSINQRAPQSSQNTRDQPQRGQPWTIPEEIEREVDEVHHRLSDVLRMSASHSSDSATTATNNTGGGGGGGGPKSQNRTRPFDSNQSQSNPIGASVSSGGGGSSMSSGAGRHNGERVASSSGSSRTSGARRSGGEKGSSGKNDPVTTRNAPHGRAQNTQQRVSTSTMSSIASGDSGHRSNPGSSSSGGGFSRGTYTRIAGTDPSLQDLNLSPIAKVHRSNRDAIGAGEHADTERKKHTRDQNLLSREERKRMEADELEARKLAILSDCQSTAVEGIIRCVRITLLIVIALILCISWTAFAWPLIGRWAHAPPAEEHYTRVYVHSQTELHAIYRVPFLSMTREQSEQLRWRIISETLEILDRNVETERLYEYNTLRRGGGERSTPAMSTGVLDVNRTDPAYLLHLRRQIHAYVTLAHRARLYARSRLDSRWKQHVVSPIVDTWSFGVRRHGYSRTVHNWLWQPSVWDVTHRTLDAIACMRQEERLPCPSVQFLEEEASLRAAMPAATLAVDTTATIDAPYINYRWSKDPTELEFFVNYVRNRITEHARDYNRAIPV